MWMRSKIAVIALSISLTNCTLKLNNESEWADTTPFYFQFGSMYFPNGESSQIDQASSMTMGADGNLYMVGRTSGSLFEDNAGSNDLFFLKMDRVGNILVQKQYGDNSAAQYGIDAGGADVLLSLDVDSNNYTYAAGYTTGDFVNTHSSNDLVFVKIDTNGGIVWAKQFGDETTAAEAALNDNSGIELLGRVTLDKTEQFLYFSGTTTGALAEANTAQDILIGKMTINGDLVFIKQLGNVTAPANGLDNSGAEYIRDIMVDSQNNLYVVGATDGSFIDTNAGGYDIFVAKFDQNGNYVAGRQFGVSEPYDSSETESIYPGMEIGPDDSIYITFDTRGNFIETNAGAGTTDDIVAMKLNTSLQTVWAKHFGANTLGTAKTLLDDRPRSVAVSPDGDFIIIGGYTYSNLGDTIAGDRDSFLLKLNSSNGSIVWLNHYGVETMAAVGGDASYYDHPGSPYIDQYGNLFLNFLTESDLFESNGDPSHTTYDICITKLTSEGKFTE